MIVGNSSAIPPTSTASSVNAVNASGRRSSRPNHDGRPLSLSARITIQAKATISVKVSLAPTPSRSDAVVAYIIAAGFAGGGAYLGLKAKSYKNDLADEIAAGMPPPDPEDPRLWKGKAFAIGADAAFALAGVSAITAIYYTFREKGPPTRAQIDARALALQPEVGVHYAGLGMEVHW